jgi:hypothetical protein
MSGCRAGRTGTGRYPRFEVTRAFLTRQSSTRSKAALAAAGLPAASAPTPAANVSWPARPATASSSPVTVLTSRSTPGSRPPAGIVGDGA